MRHGADTLAALLFFLLTAALFPLAIGPAPETLGRIAPGIVWVCALLAALLPLDRLFGADFEDGSLDQLLLCGLPPAAIALAKATAHWLVTGLPLLLAAAPLAVMLRMPDAGPAIAARRPAARHHAAVAARHHRGRHRARRPPRRRAAAAAGAAARHAGADLRRRRGGRCSPAASVPSHTCCCSPPCWLPRCHSVRWRREPDCGMPSNRLITASDFEPQVAYSPH